MQNRVEAFMRAGGQTVRSEPTLLDGEESWLRLNMLGSEFVEYKQAAQRCMSAVAALDDTEFRGSIVEMADALADMVYVIYGTAAAYGIDLGAVFDEVCDSNESKIDWATGEPWVRLPSGKIGKCAEHYRAPDIESVIFG